MSGGTKTQTFASVMRQIQRSNNGVKNHNRITTSHSDELASLTDPLVSEFIPRAYVMPESRRIDSPSKSKESPLKKKKLNTTTTTSQEPTKTDEQNMEFNNDSLFQTRSMPAISISHPIDKLQYPSSSSSPGLASSSLSSSPPAASHTTSPGTGRISTDTIESSFATKIEPIQPEKCKTIEVRLYKETNVVSEDRFIPYEQIIGLYDCIESLKEIIEKPILRPDIYSGILEPYHFLLMGGPPGSGISTLIKSFCATRKINLIIARNPDELTMELSPVNLIEYAKQHQPCIIFFDRCDSLLRTCYWNFRESCTAKYGIPQNCGWIDKSPHHNILTQKVLETCERNDKFTNDLLFHWTSQRIGKCYQYSSSRLPPSAVVNSKENYIGHHTAEMHANQLNQIWFVFSHSISEPDLTHLKNNVLLEVCHKVTMDSNLITRTSFLSQEEIDRLLHEHFEFHLSVIVGTYCNITTERQTLPSAVLSPLLDERNKNRDKTSYRASLDLAISSLKRTLLSNYSKVIHDIGDCIARRQSSEILTTPGDLSRFSDYIFRMKIQQLSTQELTDKLSAVISINNFSDVNTLLPSAEEVWQSACKIFNIELQ